MVAVDYHRLVGAQSWWVAAGYRYIDVPYWVSERAIRMTLPKFLDHQHDIFPVSNTGRHLVGSAEQSFCQMMLDGDLEPGRYCAITPCFRDEVEDDLHQKHFMKLEILDTSGATYALDRILSSAFEIMTAMSGFQSKNLKLIEYQGGYDINLGGVEIGSYGFREAEGFGWAMGTGLAEPRFSVALQRLIHLEQVEQVAN